jgi:hypothetical protein
LKYDEQSNFVISNSGDFRKNISGKEEEEKKVEKNI